MEEPGSSQQLLQTELNVGLSDDEQFEFENEPEHHELRTNNTIILDREVDITDEIPVSIRNKIPTLVKKSKLFQCDLIEIIYFILTGRRCAISFI